MNFEDWEITYKPMKNNLDCNAAVDGYMFETYGKEWEAVRLREQQEPGTVWTMVSVDDDHDGDDAECRVGWILMDGIHYVNRLGYLITEKPFVSTDEQPFLSVEY